MSAVAASKSFRPDIEGLRALAVLGVIAFHFGATGLPGGFVGVDIFFVISGYLITRHLQQEIAKRGTVNLWALLCAARTPPAARLAVRHPGDARRRLLHPRAGRAGALFQRGAVCLDLHDQCLADPLVARLFRAGCDQQPVHPFLVAVGRGAILSRLAGAAAVVCVDAAGQAWHLPADGGGGRHFVRALRLADRSSRSPGRSISRRCGPGNSPSAALPRWRCSTDWAQRSRYCACDRLARPCLDRRRLSHGIGGISPFPASSRWCPRQAASWCCSAACSKAARAERHPRARAGAMGRQALLFALSLALAGHRLRGDAGARPDQPASPRCLWL